MGLSLLKSSLWAPKDACVLKQRVMALQGRRKVVDFGTNRMRIGHATSYWSSIVTLIISCPFSLFRDIAGFLLRRATPHPFHPYNYQVCYPWTRVQIAEVVTLRSEDPELIVRVINSRQYNIYAHGTTTLQTDRQTDRQTDVQLTQQQPTGLALYVHRAVKIIKNKRSKLEIYCQVH